MPRLPEGHTSRASPAAPALCAQASLGEATAARARSEEGYESSQAALESMKRKLEVYKRENKNLMSNYDQWLKGVVSSRQQPGGAAGGAGTAAPPP